MDKRDPRYKAALAQQLNGMLAAAVRRHPSFVDDCLTSLDQLVNHWSNEAAFEFVSDFSDAFSTGGSADSRIADRAGIAETVSHLSGLFKPPIGEQRALIRIHKDKKTFAGHSNFTLLHEIGHLLQQTEYDLASRLIGISTLSADRQFEEDACGLFASHALLPDSYLRRFFTDGITAESLAEIYDDRRSRGGVLVSRQVVARRVAAMLPDGGTVTVIDDRERKGILRIRAHSDGQCDYEGNPSPANVLTPAEQAMLQHLRRQVDGEWTDDENEAAPKSRGLTFDPSVGSGAAMTGALSYAGRNRPFVFIVESRV